MKHIIICLIIVISLSCVNEEKITVTKKIIEYIPKEETDQAQPETIPKEYIITEKLPLNTEQLTLKVPIRTYITEIKGVEKLVNLKRLLIGHGLMDISFLNTLHNLEVLILESRHEFIHDLNDIKYLTKLEILYVMVVFLKTNTINFINNKNLKYIYFGNLNFNNMQNFELYLKNIPKSLEYFNLTLSSRVIITKELLESLKIVPNVIIRYDKRYSVFEINENDLKLYPNVYVGMSEDILPEKYQRKQIYGLFGISENW